MPELLDREAVRQKLAELPSEDFEAGATVLTAGSTTGKIFVLKVGAIEVVKDGVKLGEVAEAGAIFGELSALLGEPHSADVKAVQPSSFYVAEAASFFRSDPTNALYVATIVAKRLSGANGALVDIKKQLEAGQPRSAIRRSIDWIIEGFGRYGDNYGQYPIIPI